MKNFRHCIAYLAVFALIFTSCSKEEAGVQNLDSEKATLSFGAIINDLATRAASKQAVGDIPACSEDVPSYVEIVLMRGDTDVVGSSDSPHRVNLAAGQVFTVEDPALELDPGNYTLDHFAVYNAGGDLIWVAPRAGSALGEYVNNALPLAIDLRAGVKKYVDVPVLCFDNREVNQYGYLFYELDTNVALEFCFFANYCTPGGRHYAANYSVSIWSGTNNQGTPLYTNVTNQTGYYEDTDDYYATPLCFALPDNDDLDEDYLYYEVTLLDWEDNYGDVADGIVLSGTLSKRDITNNFGEGDEVEYHHLRFGCQDDGNGGETPVDTDNDGVPNGEDECPTVPGPESNNGCPVATCDQTDPNADCDNDGVLNKCDSDNANYGTFDCDGDNVLNSADNCPAVPGPSDNNGCPVTCDATNPNADCDNDGVLNKCDADNANYGTFDCDGDSVLNGVDNCPAVSGTVANNGCPEAEGCLPAPGAGCNTIVFEETVSISGFPATVEDPFYPLVLNGENVGTITFILDFEGDNKIEVNLDLNEGYTFSDIEVSLPDFVDTDICVQELNDNDYIIVYTVPTQFEDGISWPVDVSFSANICQ